MMSKLTYLHISVRDCTTHIYVNDQKLAILQINERLIKSG